MNNCLGSLVLLTLIAGRKQKSALLDALTETGGRLIKLIYGRGSTNAGYFMDALGLVPEVEKVVIICLLPREKSDAVLEMLIKKFKFDKPNTGIAFTIPVESLSL